MDNSPTKLVIGIKGIALLLIFLPLITAFIVALCSGIDAFFHPWSIIPTGATSSGFSGFINCFLVVFVYMAILSFIFILTGFIVYLSLFMNASYKEYGMAFYFHNKTFLMTMILYSIGVLVYGIIRYIIL